MSYFFPGFLGLTEAPASSTRSPSTDGSPTLSPAGAFYSTLLQLHYHVETEKLETTTLKQLVQLLQSGFASLLTQIEFLDQPTKSKSSSIEKKINC